MKLLPSLLIGLSLLHPNNINPNNKPLIIDGDTNKTEIENKIRKDFRLDTMKNLNFGIFPNDTSLNVLGNYSPWCDSLKLNYYLIMRKSREESTNPDSILERTMRHELTHYRVDKIEERIGVRSIINDKYFREIIQDYSFILKVGEPKEDSIKDFFRTFLYKGRKEITDIILDKMVNEGIAIYYDNVNIGPISKIPPLSLDMIKKSEDLDVFIYLYGLELMYPILKKYGEKGIESVLRNMPKYEDFSDLEGYQKRVMKKLNEER